MAFISLINISKLESTRRIDSEYYRPEYVHAFEQLLQCNNIPLNRVAKISDGNHLKIAGDFLSSGIRYLRGQDISTEMLIDDRNKVFIPESAFNSLSRSHIFNNDVLMTIVGANTGLVGLVYDAPNQLTANCKLGIARPENIDAAYLYAFLASKYGQFQILRAKRGGGQTGLILPDMRSLFIARWSKAFEEIISAVVYRAHSLVKKSKNVLIDAEQLLLSKLGLLDCKSKHTRSFVRRLSEVAQARRVDAEFYQPKYLQYHEILSHHSYGKTLGDLAILTKGYQARNLSDVGILYASIKDVSGFLIETTERTSESDLVLIEPKDVVLAITGATIGKTGINAANENIAISGDLVGIKPHSISPYYLQVVLASKPIQEICRQYTTGATNGHLAISDVVTFPIPLLDEQSQANISQNVISAIDYRNQSKHLLETAKRAIEIAIEENEQSAFEFINSN